MLKVLIIDDEVWMRRGIRSMLESSIYVITDMQEAGNADEALQKIQRSEFDILFVDIRMPGLDGLSFIENAVTILPLAGFIIVSGYNDFKYAKRAIHLQVVDYLLKPVDKNDLLDAFHKAVRERKQDYVQPTDADQMLMVNAMKEKLVVDLIEGRNDVTRNLSRSLQTDLEKCRFACVSFRVHNSESIINGKGISEIKLIYYIMSNFMSDLFGDVLQGIVFQHQGVLHAILYNNNLQEDVMTTQINDYVDRVLQWVKRLKFFHVRCSISSLHEQPAGIRLCYQEAMNALTYSIFMPNVIQTVYNSSIEHEGHVGYSLELEKDLYNHVVLSSLPGITETISQMMEKAFATVRTSKSLRQLLDMCWLLGERWLIEAAEHTPLPISYGDFQTNPMKYDDLEHMRRELVKHFYTVSLAINKKTNTDGKNAVSEMMEYVQNHYNEDLSLTQLAAQLHMNAAYLSDLFKEITGVGFVTYVTSIRMNKACDYLKHREIKINQIAVLVGFEDERYFSTVFKKTFGMTPREYRNQ